MRKLVLVLVMLLLASCSKDEECYCVKKTYDVVESGGGYGFELSKSETVECIDEVVYWDEDNNFIIINCY